MQVFQAVRCRCPCKTCPDWHVSDVADVQGVHFTKDQAEVVAFLLTTMENNKPETPEEEMATQCVKYLRVVSERD